MGHYNMNLRLHCCVFSSCHWQDEPFVSGCNQLDVPICCIFYPSIESEWIHELPWHISVDESETLLFALERRSKPLSSSSRGVRQQETPPGELQLPGVEDERYRGTLRQLSTTFSSFSLSYITLAVKFISVDSSNANKSWSLCLLVVHDKTCFNSWLIQSPSNLLGV